MFLCLRFDLDYVPWDAHFDKEFGHGEPAMVLRLLDFARSGGLKFHFFISARTLRAFPTAADAVLGEGHDLDWLCTEPTERSHQVAAEQFLLSGHKPIGFGLEKDWPQMASPWATEFQFASCPADSCPQAIRSFPVTLFDTPNLARGESPLAWSGQARTLVEKHHNSNGQATISFQPSALGRFDPKLAHFQGICEAAISAGVPIRTLRDAIRET